MSEPPVHLIEIEGSTERLREAEALESVRLHGPTIRDVGPNTHAIHAVASDEGLAALRGLGLEVRIVEDAAARVARLEAMARQIRDAGPE